MLPVCAKPELTSRDAFRDAKCSPTFQSLLLRWLRVFGLQACLSNCGNRHREATSTRGSQQLFGISADTALKSR
jgi:hypothetical protein